MRVEVVDPHRLTVGAEAAERTMPLPQPFLVLATPSGSQEPGNERSGLALAKEACASCHAILQSEARSPRPQAPPFERIANTRGMSPLALTVVLQTAHKTMPNIMLDTKERHDVIAYIMSLRTTK